MKTVDKEQEKAIELLDENFEDLVLDDYDVENFTNHLKTEIKKAKESSERLF